MSRSKNAFWFPTACGVRPRRAGPGWIAVFCASMATICRVRRMLLYLFLAAVADRHGLSFYSDHTLTSRLRLSPQVLEKARQELLDRDLIAYQLPLVQVLSLPAPGVRRRPEPGQGLMLLGDVFRQVAARRNSRPKEEHAMKVALWAEIRRLSEIDKLSGRAIARRLHCSRHTVAAALKLQQPPRPDAAQRASLLDPYRGADQGTAGQVSRPLGRAHPRGDRPRTAGLHRQRHRAAPLPAQGPAGTRPRLPGGALRTGPGDAGRLGRMRPRAGRLDHAQGLGVRGRALL